jgi:hypothetical protein
MILPQLSEMGRSTALPLFTQDTSRYFKQYLHGMRMYVPKDWLRLRYPKD